MKFIKEKKVILDINKIRSEINILFENLNNAIEKSKFSGEEKLKIEVLTVFSNFFKDHEIDFYMILKLSLKNHLPLKVDLYSTSDNYF